MVSTCLICCEEADIFVLPPCNHKEICWKCCVKLIRNDFFSCPFCKSEPEHRSIVLFVTADQMHLNSFTDILKLKPLRSSINTSYYYSTHEVARFVEQATSQYCVQCGDIFQNLNFLKKHYHEYHKLQFCDVCLQSKKCLPSEQVLYSETELIGHLKQGQVSLRGEQIIYHPYCQFCKVHFFDLDAFTLHFRRSAHFKCDICFTNCDRLKYVYYRDYKELQKHFRKSHFLCEQDDCVNRKLENVFVSEQALNQHLFKVHVKKGDPSFKEQYSFMPMFNRKPSEDLFEFDGIGKNFESEFTHIETVIHVHKETHRDSLIDIREFYQQICKTYMHRSLPEISERIYDFSRGHQQPTLLNVWLFKPLEMSSLSGSELEKFLLKVFGKQGERIWHLFFKERHQFRSFTEFFSQIDRQMFKYSPFAFYMSFPQLIRFMKNQNPAKLPMDEYYLAKLRKLKVNKEFIFHTYERYSDILIKFTDEIEADLQLKADQLDLLKYETYLKDLSHNYYLEHQKELFYVPKDKITNIYHMIDRCKAKDLLRMNWLLKIGMSNQTYTTIREEFYFKKEDQCHGAFKHISFQELALIYAYCLICLDAILDKQEVFEEKKIATHQPFYLSKILRKIVTQLTPAEIKNIEKLEEKSQKNIIEAAKSFPHNNVINEAEYPALPRRDEPLKKASKDLELGFGRPSIQQWQEGVRSRANPHKKDKNKDFPSLFTKQYDPVKEKKIEEDFPSAIYVFEDKQVNKANRINQNNSLDMIGFHNMNPFPKGYDESKSRAVMAQTIHASKAEEILVSRKKRGDSDEDEDVHKGWKKKQRFKKEEPKGESREVVPRKTPVEDREQENLFQNIEREAEMRRKAEEARPLESFMDVDQECVEAPKEEKPVNTFRYDYNDFQSLSSLRDTKAGLVNSLIDQFTEKKAGPQITVKSGKRGKKYVVQSVNLKDL